VPMTLVAQVSAGFEWARANDRLRRQMKYIIGPRCRKHPCDRVRVTKVSHRVAQAVRQAQLPEQRRLCGGGQAETPTPGPNPISHSLSHEPLKPVCPVIRTRLPAKD